MLISCAPIRSPRNKEISPDKAVAFVRKHFVGLFPEEPAFSMPEYGVRFDGNRQGEFAWVNASGRIDWSLYIPTSVPSDGPIAMNVLDILQPISRMYNAVNDPEYRRVFG